MLLKDCRFPRKRQVIEEHITKIFEYVQAQLIYSSFNENLIENYIWDILLDSEYDVDRGCFYFPITYDEISSKMFARDIVRHIQENPEDFQ